MNDFPISAAITAALRTALQNALSGKLSAEVTVGRPDERSEADCEKSGINIHLHQVELDRYFRGSNSPTRTARGSLGQTPWATLNLHYLFTFFGDQDRLEPQRLLGIVASALNTVEIFKPDQHDDDPAPSDPGREINLVRFSPLNISPDEMMKLWSYFHPMPYRLSVLYMARVFLTEDDEAKRR